MEIEVARPETITASGRDRNFVCELAITVFEDFQRPWLLGLAAGGVVAARDKDRHRVRRCDAYLMRINAGVEQSRLLHLLAHGTVAVDLMHSQATRNAV